MTKLSRLQLSQYSSDVRCGSHGSTGNNCLTCCSAGWDDHLLCSAVSQSVSHTNTVTVWIYQNLVQTLMIPSGWIIMNSDFYFSSRRSSSLTLVEQVFSSDKSTVLQLCSHSHVHQYRSAGLSLKRYFILVCFCRLALDKFRNDPPKITLQTADKLTRSVNLRLYSTQSALIIKQSNKPSIKGNVNAEKWKLKLSDCLTPLHSLFPSDWLSPPVWHTNRLKTNHRAWVQIGLSLVSCLHWTRSLSFLFLWL